MAPPKSAAKLRKRKNNNTKKSDGGNDFDVIDMFGTEKEKNGQSDFDLPLPPMMMGQDQQSNETTQKGQQNNEGDISDDEQQEQVMPQRRKGRGGAAGSRQAGEGGTSTQGVPKMSGKKESSQQGIKTTPLILLILLTGTTLLPAILYVGDMASNYLGNNNVLGQLGYRLGVGAVPRKRVLSFYEKHNPDKISEVPTILSKHYGEYPKLIKKLERKYQDYGYFHGWEEDEAPMMMVRDSLEEAYSFWIQKIWNRHAPVALRTAARNAKYNFSKIYKKGSKIWKKQVWPVLEPYIGVPDERTAAKQKRKDAEEARKRREQQAGGGTSSGRRKKNRDYRDDVDE
jgi:hypothetical protein